MSVYKDNVDVCRISLFRPWKVNLALFPKIHSWQIHDCANFKYKQKFCVNVVKIDCNKISIFTQ